MPSKAYGDWTSFRAEALDEIEQAHAKVGGTNRGRRYATQQINRAYVVLLASQFQGFCRDLHQQCITHIVTHTPANLQGIMQLHLSMSRKLYRGNANYSAIHEDFNRLGMSFWTDVDNHHIYNIARRGYLELLNRWRNAIAHHDFDPNKLGGTTTLRLSQVKQWRQACKGLAVSFDDVMFDHLQNLTGHAPW